MTADPGYRFEHPRLGPCTVPAAIEKAPAPDTTGLQTYRLPPRFYADHDERGLPEQGRSVLVRATQASALVAMDAAAYDELRSDALYYAEEMGRPETGFGGDARERGLIASARATVRALDKQGRAV